MKTLQEEFITAICNGRIERIRDCLKQGVDVETVIPKGVPVFDKNNAVIKVKYNYTPLMWATQFCSFDIVQLLLAQGANINAQARGFKIKYDCEECQLETALMLAIERKSFDLVKLLLAYNANPNIFDESSNITALCLAQYFLPETTQILIDYGASINFRESFSATPLMSAVCSNSVDSAKILIEYGADIHILNELDEPLSIIAAENECLDTLKFMLDINNNVNFISKTLNSVLIQAILKNNFALVQIALDYGADINITIADGENLITFFSEECSLEMLDFLMKNGATYEKL